MGLIDADMIGKRYGKLVVIEFIQSIKRQGKLYLCQCDCGNTREALVGRLNSGAIAHCGCGTQEHNESMVIEMSGQKIGKWMVLKTADKPIGSTMNKKGAYWECQCECGTIKTVYSSDLRNGHTKSCGCGKAEETAARSRKYEPWYRSALTVFKQTYSDGNLTMEQFLELAKMNCHYCGIVPSNKYNVFKAENKSPTKFSLENGDYIYNGLDRVDNNRPHDLDNLVPCCRKCGTAKLHYTVDEFKEWLTRAYKFYIEVK